MIKNKDGSYNKFSLLILSLIAITVIGIIGSIILQIPEIIINDNIQIIIIFTGIIIIGSWIYFILYKKYKKNILSVSYTTSSISPIQIHKNIEPIQPSIQIHEPIKIVPTIPKSTKLDISEIQPTHYGLPIVHIVIAIFVGTVTIMIGSIIINSMINAIPNLQTNSAFASTQTEIINTIGNTFTLGGIALLLIPLILIMSYMIRR